MNQVAADAQTLRNLLEDYLRLQQFEKDCTCTKDFITKNMAIMTDQSHLDPTNINMKVENHKKLEEDLFSRKNSMEVITK